MAEKRNFWTQVIGAMNGAISFGGISKDKSVTSSVELKGLDGRHFFDMTEDGVREGWTTMNSPGATQINSGEDLSKGQNAVFINAENGITKAKNSMEQFRKSWNKYLPGRSKDLIKDQNLDVEEIKRLSERSDEDDGV